MRDFDLCRICFRELANDGKIRVKKSSWRKSMSSEDDFPTRLNDFKFTPKLHIMLKLQNNNITLVSISEFEITI